MSTSSPRQVATLSDTLDYSWWASDGPTVGCMSAMAMQVAWLVPGAEGLPPRRIDLHMLAPSATGRVDLEIDLLAGPTGIRLVTVTFVQGHPVAQAAVYFSDLIPASARPAGSIPPVLPPECYSEMEFLGEAPPVTSRFSYRPTAEADGSSKRPGWDLVWLRAKDCELDGAARAVSFVDSWYPPVHLAELASMIKGEVPAPQEPIKTSLLGASLLFPSSPSAYTGGTSVLLASRLEALSEGHHYERCEIWSESGKLLVSGHILRSDHRSRAGADALRPARDQPGRSAQ